MLAIFDVFGVSKIVSAQCTPRGLIITKVTLLLIDCEAMTGDSNQGITARIFVSKVIQPSLYYWFFKTAGILNQRDCQETFAVNSRHGATPQWRHSKWLTATTRPRALGLFDVNSTYDIRKTYCRSISAEIRLCWHWILCLWKTHHV